MRIGVDARCLVDGGRTGVEEYTVGVVRAMARIAKEDTFVLFSNSFKRAKIPAFSETNIEYCTYRYPNKVFTALQKTTGYPGIDRLSRADALFVPGVRFIPHTIRVPIISTFHDLSFIRHPEAFTLHRRLWHTLMNPRGLAQNSTRIITVSHATARDVSTLYGVPESKMRVIYSGIRHIHSVLRDSEAVCEARKRYALPDRYILFLGTIEPRKNIDALLDAYESVRQNGIRHHLVLAGVWGWERKELLRRIHTHRFTKEIHLIGFVHDQDKPMLYSAADLFVYPSIYEGFGFPPLEAIAAGTPVITSYNSAIPEVAGKWATLVNPYDANEIAEVIRERLRDPRPVSGQVSSEVRNTYSWERAGAETLDVIYETVRR